MVARFRLVKAGPELFPEKFLSRDSTVSGVMWLVFSIRWYLGWLVFGMVGIWDGWYLGWLVFFDVVIQSLCFFEHKVVFMFCWTELVLTEYIRLCFNLFEIFMTKKFVVTNG
jgi:hypothetical protein